MIMVNATVAIKSNQIVVLTAFFRQHNSIEPQSILGTIQGFHLFVMLLTFLIFIRKYL